MAFDRISHAISVAEDAGHEVKLVMRDGQVIDRCFVDVIAERTITIFHRISGKHRRTRIKTEDIVEVIQIKEEAA